MIKTPEEKIAEIQRKFVRLSIVEAPGLIMIGLWVHAKYGPKDKLLHPLLSNETVVDALILFGGLIVILSIIQSVKLAIRRAKLTKEITRKNRFESSI